MMISDKWEDKLANIVCLPKEKLTCAITLLKRLPFLSLNPLLINQKLPHSYASKSKTFQAKTHFYTLSSIPNPSWTSILTLSLSLYLSLPPNLCVYTCSLDCNANPHFFSSVIAYLSTTHMTSAPPPLTATPPLPLAFTSSPWKAWLTWTPSSQLPFLWIFLSVHQGSVAWRTALCETLPLKWPRNFWHLKLFHSASSHSHHWFLRVWSSQSTSWTTKMPMKLLGLIPIERFFELGCLVLLLGVWWGAYFLCFLWWMLLRFGLGCWVVWVSMLFMLILHWLFSFLLLFWCMFSLPFMLFFIKDPWLGEQWQI